MSANLLAWLIALGIVVVGKLIWMVWRPGRDDCD